MLCVAGALRAGSAQRYSGAMPDVILYDNSISSNCLKARFFLAELGIEAELRHVPFTWPRPVDYVELNPFGRLPTLVDGDIVIAESNAILRYLARREGRNDLYPVEAPGYARVEWALDAWATNVRPALAPAERIAFMETGNWDEGGGRAEDADQEALKPALEQASAGLDRFEQFCADNGTVTGTLTIVDFCIASVLWRAQRLPLDFTRWPKTAKIEAAMSARPAFLAAEPVA